MSSMTRLDTEKLRVRRIVATAAISAVAVVFLLLSNTFAVVSALPSGAEPSERATDEQVAPDRGEPQRTRADRAPREPAAYRLADDRAAEEISVSEPGVPPESEPASPAASEQRIFKARRALETTDSREFVRQAALPR